MKTKFSGSTVPPRRRFGSVSGLKGLFDDEIGRPSLSMTTARWRAMAVQGAYAHALSPLRALVRYLRNEVSAMAERKKKRHDDTSYELHVSWQMANV